MFRSVEMSFYQILNNRFYASNSYPTLRGGQVIKRVFLEGAGAIRRGVIKLVETVVQSRPSLIQRQGAPPWLDKPSTLVLTRSDPTFYYIFDWLHLCTLRSFSRHQNLKQNLKTTNYTNMYIKSMLAYLVKKKYSRRRKNYSNYQITQLMRNTFYGKRLFWNWK